MVHLDAIGLRVGLVVHPVQSRPHSGHILVLQHFVVSLVAHEFLVHAVVLLFLDEIIVFVSVLPEGVFLLGTWHSVFDPFDELPVGSTEVGGVVADGWRELSPGSVGWRELVIVGGILVVLAAVGNFPALAS